MNGIEAARRAGFAPIRINTVVMGGVNDGEIESILEFCAERGFTLRLIETMPMGATGPAAAPPVTIAWTGARPASVSSPPSPSTSAPPATASA